MRATSTPAWWVWATRRRRLAPGGADDRRRSVHLAGGLDAGELDAAGAGDPLLPVQHQGGQGWGAGQNLRLPKELVALLGLGVRTDHPPGEQPGERQGHRRHGGGEQDDTPGQGAGSGGRLPVSAVRLHDAADTLTLVLGQGGLGEATLRPQLQNGRPTLHLEDAEILGSPAPAGLVDRFQDCLSDRAGVDHPLGLKATSLDVTDTGLDVTLTGGPTQLPAQDTAR
uniref:DUF2993 domain-containing protein n=1 Tax=Streptomyces sp. NBC_00093 TaxID=2975649 RepID=A0AAU2AG31_9ACTN